MATGKLTAANYGVAVDDWHVLQTARPNALLIGPESAIAGFLELLLPVLRHPIVHVRDGRFATPSSSTATLILREVSRLDTDGQLRLSEWLSAADGRTQVISTSSCPLFPLVERNELSAPLYYSLNVVMIALRDPDAP